MAHAPVRHRGGGCGRIFGLRGIALGPVRQRLDQQREGGHRHGSEGSQSDCRAVFMCSSHEFVPFIASNRNEWRALVVGQFETGSYA